MQPRGSNGNHRPLGITHAAPITALTRVILLHMRRRDFIASAAGTLASAAAASPTNFQLACMTLPYSAFPLERALTGIRGAGFRYVAWGVSHERKPLLDVTAPASAAASLATRCRDLSLEPVMMFAVVHLEADGSADAHLRRIEQAAAARIPYLLTFGGTRNGLRDSIVRTLKQIGPAAKAAGVTVLLKQHGGDAATGDHCARILREVNEPAVRLCYDAGNVLDYQSHNPITDIRTCLSDIRAFAIKDHRDTPRDEDCGPGFGEIDHYKLLAPVMDTGLTMPLAFENIFEPLVPRPTTPEAIDALARRSREYLETVINGLRESQKGKS